MALYNTKDGVIEIPDDVPEARRQQILKEQGIGGRTAAVDNSPRKRQLSPEQREVQNRVNKMEQLEKRSSWLPGRDAIRTLSNAGTQGALFGLRDELAGATGYVGSGIAGAVRGAMRGENPFTAGHQAGAREYRIARDVERERERRDNAAHPVLSTVGNIAGSLNPATDIVSIGKGLKAGGTAIAKLSPSTARAARAVGQTRVAQAAARAGGRVADNAIGSAVASGAASGGLSAIGEGEDISNLPGDVLRGATMGGLTGGAFGLAGRGLQHGADFLGSNKPGRVEERAYKAIGGALDRAGSKGQRVARRKAEEEARKAGMEVIPGQMAATQAEQRLARGEKLGTDEILSDLSPSLRSTQAAIARNPGLEVANDIGRAAEARADVRPQRFVDELTSNASQKNTDAVAREVAIQQARKAAGARDYSPEVMKRPFTWNDRLEDMLNGPNTSEDIKSGLRNAAATIRNTYDENGKLMDPTALGYRFNEAGDVMYMKVPNMEAMDLLKRGFDKDIGAALKAGDRDSARRISTALNLLKGRLAEANPGYAKALANQRDLFQKSEALEKGQGLLTRLQGNRPGKGAREILAELKALPANMQDDMRIGAMDALTRMDAKTNPLQQWQSMTRSPEQKQVMEWIMGDKQGFNRFNRWVRRERNALSNDIASNTKVGSITSNVGLADEHVDTQANPLLQAFHGWAFGGGAGALASATRAIGNKLKGRTEDVQELMGQILQSKGSLNGESISEGIRRTGSRVLRRERDRRGVLRAVGRGTGPLLTGAVVARDQDEEY